MSSSLPPPVRYTGVAIALHWVIALAIPASYAVGLLMVDLPLSPWKLKVYSWHKWAGVTIFALVALRAAWRLGHPPPALPGAMPAWQRSAASVTHGLLYVLMFAVPLSGWLMSSAKGFQTVYFGVLPLPDLLAKNAGLGDLLASVHAWLNNALLALAFGHAAIAIKHHVHDRDDVLVRMLPMLTAPATRTTPTEVA